MKRNLLQILTLCLCIVLLVITVMQGKKLDEYRMQMENKLQDMENTLHHDIQNISWTIERELEEAARVIENYTFKPTGIDSDNHALQADVSVILKQWYEDTEVILLAEVGGNQQNIPMTHDGNGGFTAEIALPLEGELEIILDAQITGGGLTRRENLQSWGDCAMLLPLRYSGGGWSGPNYDNGQLSSRFSIDMESQWEQPVKILNPEFRVYRNGELTQTISAIADPYSSGDYLSYTPNTPDNHWTLPCDVGDVIIMRFCCTDEFGLGYDFFIYDWVVAGESSDEVSYGSGTGSSDLEIFWPEA